MTKEQTALDIARRMAELGERSHAVTAYTLALADARDRQPETELEAALYLFENGGNYKVAYDAFRSLYRRGFQRETLLELMTQAFYQPNIKLLKSRYEKNCRLLRKYPYCFQQDFPAFEELPLRFYPTTTSATSLYRRDGDLRGAFGPPAPGGQPKLLSKPGQARTGGGCVLPV